MVNAGINTSVWIIGSDFTSPVLELWPFPPLSIFFPTFEFFPVFPVWKMKMFVRQQGFASNNILIMKKQNLLNYLDYFASFSRNFQQFAFSSG